MPTVPAVPLQRSPWPPVGAPPNRYRLHHRQCHRRPLPPAVLGLEWHSYRQQHHQLHQRTYLHTAIVALHDDAASRAELHTRDEEELRASAGPEEDGSVWEAYGGAVATRQVPGDAMPYDQYRQQHPEDPAFHVWETHAGIVDFLTSPTNPHKTENTDNRSLFMLYVSGGYHDMAEELLATMRQSGQTLGPDDFVSLIAGWVEEVGRGSCFLCPLWLPVSACLLFLLRLAWYLARSKCERGAVSHVSRLTRTGKIPPRRARVWRNVSRRHQAHRARVRADADDT